MSPTNYFISTTNIVNFQRFTNVFRGVVEQIYIKLDTQQDFRQNTPMRLSNFFSLTIYLPKLSFKPINFAPNLKNFRFIRSITKNQVYELL